MVDITNKKNTLRIAKAEATLTVSKEATIQSIRDNNVPKGDIFEMSRAAGLLGIKKTPLLLPDCHPLPIEFAGFEFEISGLEIKISCTLKTIYKTGVEVEAMHGASIVALNMYDMLKPLDKGVEICAIRLISKKGGKSDRFKVKASVSGSVTVCSDTVSKGEKKDRAGKEVIKSLENWKVKVVKLVKLKSRVPHWGFAQGPDPQDHFIMALPLVFLIVSTCFLNVCYGLVL